MEEKLLNSGKLKNPKFQLYLKDTFPSFAEAHFFGTNTPEAIEERRHSIENLLNFVFKNEVLCKTRIFQTFVEVPIFSLIAALTLSIADSQGEALYRQRLGPAGTSSTPLHGPLLSHCLGDGCEPKRGGGGGSRF